MVHSRSQERAAGTYAVVRTLGTPFLVEHKRDEFGPRALETRRDLPRSRRIGVSDLRATAIEH
jgi:hypothetical protein